MNFAMWGKALQVIPRITKDEWNKLDVISKWLISTRAAVLIMTFISATIAGLLAIIDGKFNLLNYVLLALGLILAHATNNLLNDYTDHKRGVDKDNYFRSQYGPQPLEHGLMTEKQLLTYAAVTGLLALAAGAYLVVSHGTLALILLALGAFFVLFYTWPLKYIGLGEITVLLVWGPLMVGGGYFVIAGGPWNWNVVIASLPYALGVTTVIFGKHIDKFTEDKTKHIHTLPVILGEKLSRYIVIGMMVLSYVSVIYLVAIGFFTPIMLVVLFALIVFKDVWQIYRQPRPTEPPANYPKDTWPLWFVSFAFIHNRRFGLLYLAGLIGEVLLRVVFHVM
jgi:1,4-dihydroxy-2-naphthoate polyprenyltransferase